MKKLELEIFDVCGLKIIQDLEYDISWLELDPKDTSEWKIYTNQTGGHACNHRSMIGKDITGFILNKEVLENELEGFIDEVGSWWCDGSGLTEKQKAKFINILEKYSLFIDVKKWSCSEEAWVHANYRNEKGWPCSCVIVWTNSD